MKPFARMVFAPVLVFLLSTSFIIGDLAGALPDEIVKTSPGPLLVKETSKNEPLIKDEFSSSRWSPLNDSHCVPGSWKFDGTGETRPPKKVPCTRTLTATSSSLTLTPTDTILEVTPTPTVSLSITETVEEIPDNMYAQAENCLHLPKVRLCGERFCACIFQEKKPGATMMRKASNDCGLISNINCHYLLFCVKQQVTCLRKLSVIYSSDRFSNGHEVLSNGESLKSLPYKKSPNKFDYPTTTPVVTSENKRDDTCVGLQNIYDNVSRVSSNVNYYDSLLYRECIDYMSYKIKKTGGGVCMSHLVSMYVCGPSFAAISGMPNPISYKPLPKGERRLLIMITARFVGLFEIAELDVSREFSKHSAIYATLSDSMFLCFKAAIGIDGELNMAIADNALLVHYDVGVSEADPWVGDEVTANALNLMVRDTSWLHEAQVVLDVLSGMSRALHPPIVVYEVTLEPGKSAVTESVLHASSIAAITIVVLIGASAIVAYFVLFCRRSGRPYTETDPVFLSNNFEGDEEFH